MVEKESATTSKDDLDLRPQVPASWVSSLTKSSSALNNLGARPSHFHVPTIAIKEELEEQSPAMRDPLTS